MLDIQLFSNFQKLCGRTLQGLHFLLKQLFHIQPLRGRKIEWRTCFRYPCVILPISLRYPSVILPSSLMYGWTTEGQRKDIGGISEGYRKYGHKLKATAAHGSSDKQAKDNGSARKLGNTKFSQLNFHILSLSFPLSLSLSLFLSLSLSLYLYLSFSTYLHNYLSTYITISSFLSLSFFPILFLA